jgi:DNA modification methylase
VAFLPLIIYGVSISTVLIVKNKNMIDIRLSDNLELMAEMQDNTVDLIYCDILYGTGRKFKDYQDLKPKREIIEEHYIPRIKEMHRILKPTGSIYLQMGEEISHWIRCILDDVFGYSNFMTEIIWWLNNVSGFKTQANNWIRNNDKILFYKKDKLIFNKLSEPLSKENIYTKR